MTRKEALPAESATGLKSKPKFLPLSPVKAVALAGLLLSEATKEATPVAASSV